MIQLYASRSLKSRRFFQAWVARWLFICCIFLLISFYEAASFGNAEDYLIPSRQSSLHKLMGVGKHPFVHVHNMVDIDGRGLTGCTSEVS